MDFIISKAFWLLAFWKPFFYFFEVRVPFAV